ncbi:MAG: tRNA pseudouridine(38-40) synthase TruA [Verrucomicrobiota bacterium]|nr:tRNA pseudouridine(38-40) synthase TruA [Verrucomicrobiota bacterium]
MSSIRQKERVPTFKLLIAYDGKPFAGWQSQENSVAIQDLLEKALAEIYSTRVVLHGSGRTDAGVHALGQVASFQPPSENPRLTCDQLVKAINTRIPREIRIMSATQVAEGFHARFDAIGKEYHFHVVAAQTLHPLLLNRAWLVRGPLNIEAMREAAGYMLGTHDFASFAANRGHEPEDTIRTLSKVNVREQQPFTPNTAGEDTQKLIVFEVAGDGFLYKMVRTISGTLVAVGQGKIKASEVITIINAKSRSEAPMTAPADGLYLVRVNYKD